LEWDLSEGRLDIMLRSTRGSKQTDLIFPEAAVGIKDSSLTFHSKLRHVSISEDPLHLSVILRR